MANSLKKTPQSLANKGNSNDRIAAGAPQQTIPTLPAAQKDYDFEGGQGYADQAYDRSKAEIRRRQVRISQQSARSARAQQAALIRSQSRNRRAMASARKRDNQLRRQQRTDQTAELNLAHDNATNALNTSTGIAQDTYNQAYQQAQGTVGEARDNSLAALQSGYSQAQGVLDPYQQFGQGGMNRYGDFMGLNGAQQQSDALNQYGTQVAGMYQAVDDRANEETLRAMNATGGANSGRAWLALQRSGQERQERRMNDYMNRLQGIYGQGQQAASQMSSNYAQEGAQTADTYMGAGNTLAGLQTSQGNAIAGSETARGNNLAQMASELGSNKSKVIGEVEGSIANNALAMTQSQIGQDYTTARDLADINQWGANTRFNMEYWAGNQTLDLERWFAEQSIALSQSGGGGGGGGGIGQIASIAGSLLGGI